MLAMNMKSKRGRKLKSKFANVTCQTEATTASYLQYNQIFCDCPKKYRNCNRKHIFKIIKRYFAEEGNNKSIKCYLMRYMKRRQNHSKHVTKLKSDKSVIYVGTKKLKSKKAMKDLSRKSVIYIGTTYNTLDATQNNDIIDLTQADPTLRLTTTLNPTQKSIEKPSLLYHCFPKTITKYYKRPLFNSMSDSVLVMKTKKMSDLKRKRTHSENFVQLNKKFKPELIPLNRSMCFKQFIMGPSQIPANLVDNYKNFESDIHSANSVINEKNNTIDFAKEMDIPIIELAPNIIQGDQISFLHTDNIGDIVNETNNVDVIAEINVFDSMDKNDNIPKVPSKSIVTEENIAEFGITLEDNEPKIRISEENVEYIQNLLCESVLTTPDIIKYVDDTKNTQDLN